MALLIRRPGNFIQEGHPLEDLMRLSRSFGEDIFQSTAGINLYETSHDVVVEMAVPGLRPDELTLQLEENILTISGEHKEDAEEADKRHYHQQQLRYARFSQVVSLPSTVEGDKAEATFENGILRVSLPKVEAAKPKQIQIKTA